MNVLKYIVLIIISNLIFSSELSNQISQADDKIKSYAIISSNIESISTDIDACIATYDFYLSIDELNKAAEFITLALNNSNGKNETAIAKSEEIKTVINTYKNSKSILDKANDENSILESIDMFVNGIQDFPDIALFYYGLALSYNKYHIILKSSENDSDISDYENKVYLRKSVEYYRKSYNLNPYNYNTNIGLTLNENSSEILNISKQLVKEAKSYLKSDELDLAKENLLLAIEFDSNYGVSYWYLGEYFKKIGNYHEAISNYSEGIGLEGDNIPILHSIGYCYEKIDENQNAVTYYEKVLQIDPFYTKSKFALANILYQTQTIDNVNRAEILLVDITIDDPDFENGFYVLASLYFDKKDYVNSALTCLDGISFHSRSYKLYYKLAASYNELGEYEKAKDSAIEGLKFKKKYAPASFELGIAWMNLCNRYEAERAFKASGRDRKFKSESNKYLERELNLHIKNNPNCK